MEGQNVSFLEGVHPSLIEFLHIPPFVPTLIVPRGPTTSTTPEVPGHKDRKPEVDWNDLDKESVELGKRGKRLLIMAIPNEIFESLDLFDTSKELWSELEYGPMAMKNHRIVCINEYYNFKALEGENIKGTYESFNSLVNKCRRFGIQSTGEENNVRFHQRLNSKWLNLTMPLSSTLDLENWTLWDIFGILASHEHQVYKLKSVAVGGPLALVGKEAEEEVKEKKAEWKKKKKVLIVESESEDSKDEVSMKQKMKTLALITRQYRDYKKPNFRGQGRYDREETEMRVAEAIRKKGMEAMRER